MTPQNADTHSVTEDTVFALPPAEIIYVAPSGSDYAADGYSTPANSAQKPWRTIYMAVRRAQPGDTIEVAPGIYTEKVGWGAKPGTPDAPIRLNGNGAVTIQGSLQMDHADYWKVDGIKIIGGAPQFVVKFNGGTGWTISHCEISGGTGSSNLMVIGDPHDYSILDNKIYDVSSSGPLMNKHNIYMMPGYESGPGLIQGNTLTNADNGANIKIGPGSSGVGGSNIKIINNTMSDAGAGIVIGGVSSHITITGNKITGTSKVPAYDAGIFFNKWRGHAVTQSNNIIKDYSKAVRAG